jgi:hypothetical protein
MEPNITEIEKHSPPSLLAGFTKTRFAFWFALATVIHVIVIGGLSLGYIRDTWIDPQGAAARKAAAEAAAKAEAEKAHPPTPATPPTTNVAVTTPVAAPATNTEAATLAARTNAAVVKAITEVAPTNDIPQQPDDLGLSIKDTNIR